MKLKLFIFVIFFGLITPNLFAGLFFKPSTGWTWNQRVLKATAKEQLEYCKSLETAKKYSSAIDHYNLLIKVYYNSPEAIEAYVRIGELLILEGRFNSAEKYFENLLNLQIEETSKTLQAMSKKKKKKKGKLLDDKTKQMMFNILVRDLQKNGQKEANENPLLNLDIQRIFDNLYVVAKGYIGGARYKFLGTLPLWKQKSKFLFIYSYIILRAPNYAKCPSMQMEIALYKLKEKDYDEAITEFKKLSYDYSLSEEAQDVSYYIGLCHLNSSKGPAYNQENIDFAEANIKDYLLSQPDGAQVEPANEALLKIATLRSENNLIKIKFFVGRHQWLAAKIYINETLIKFPDTKAAIEAKRIGLKHKEIGI